MKSLIINQMGCVETITVADPYPSKNEVIVRMEACGICGTDYAKYIRGVTVDEWGHEVVGRIVDSNNNDGLLNKLVTVRTSWSCKSCDICKGNTPFKCKNWSRVRINGFSEYIAININGLVLLKYDNMIESDILIEPMYVAMSLVNRLSPAPYDQVAIIGNGTIGLLSALYLMTKGVKHITLFGRRTMSKKMDIGRKWGLECHSYDDLPNYLSNCNKIINTADYSTMRDVILCSAPFSDITFNGISEKSLVPLDMDVWHFKNLTISPSFPHPQQSFDGAVEFIQDKRMLLSSLITHEYPLDEGEKAFDTLMRSRDDCIKVVIKNN